MELTESDAQETFDYLIGLLAKRGAADLISGIEESRRLGVEEPVSVANESFLKTLASRAEIRQVGTVRRRPLSSIELLKLAIERLEQRLIVLPAIGAAVAKRTGPSTTWLVDKEFISSESSPALETAVSALMPNGTLEVQGALEKLKKVLPQVAVARGRNG